MRGTISIIAAVLATGGRAYADLDDDLRDRWRAWEGAVGMPIGDVPDGDYTAGGLGVSLAAGRRWGHVAAFGEYTFLAEHGTIGSDPRERRAYLDRFSAGVRYDLLNSAIDHEAPLALFVEGGVGEELLAWAEGGTLHRPDVSAGFGVSFLIPGEHHGYYGVTLRLTLIGAHAPAPLDAAVRCGGPCYAPSSPMQTDVGVIYSMAFPFGR